MSVCIGAPLSLEITMLTYLASINGVARPAILNGRFDEGDLKNVQPAPQFWGACEHFLYTSLKA